MNVPARSLLNSLLSPPDDVPIGRDNGFESTVE